MREKKTAPSEPSILHVHTYPLFPVTYLFFKPKFFGPTRRHWIGDFSILVPTVHTRLPTHPPRCMHAYVEKNTASKEEKFT